MFGIGVVGHDGVDFLGRRVGQVEAEVLFLMGESVRNHGLNQVTIVLIVVDEHVNYGLRE